MPTEQSVCDPHPPSTYENSCRLTCKIGHILLTRAFWLSAFDGARSSCKPILGTGRIAAIKKRSSLRVVPRQNSIRLELGPRVALVTPLQPSVVRQLHQAILDHKVVFIADF